MISLERYNEWLSDSDAKRVLLVILTGFDGINHKEFYMSSQTFYTEPDSSKPNIQFEGRIEGEFFIQKSISFFEKGLGSDNLGELELNNSDTELDYFQKLQWNKQSILVLMGSPDWLYENFLVKPLLFGIIDSVAFDDNSIKFSFMDRLGILDGPVQSNLLENNNLGIPLAYGVLRNIEPININPNTHEYQWNDGPVDTIDQVYDRGVIVANYISYNNYGKFAVNNRPLGTITIDGQSKQREIDQIVKDLMCRLGPFEENDLDIESFKKLLIVKPYQISLYITERENRLDVLDRLFASFGASLIITDGKVSVVWLKNPENELPIAFLEPNEIALENFSIKPLGGVQWRTRLKYNKNYTIQKDSDLAGNITDPSYPNPRMVNWLRNEYRIAKYEDQTISSDMADPDAIETVLYSIEDAETECAYRQNILGKQRFLCEFTAFSMPLALSPGDIIRLIDARYHLDEGKNMQLLNIRYYPLLGKSEIEAFF